MTILITGSTDGIGKATAIELAKSGHKVIIHGRNKEKCIKTLSIIEKTYNQTAAGYVCGDLSKKEDIEYIANKIKSDFKDLNVLINNAGVFKQKKETNKIKVELTFMVNYLAVFILTGLLFDILYKNRPSKIINVASMAHAGRLDFNNLQGEQQYDGYTAYGYSKLADIMFTFSLHRKIQKSKKYSDITVNCLHPGVISTKLLHAGWGIGGAPVKEGANKITYMLTEKVNNISGKYFSDMRISEPATFTYNEAAQEKLWNLSKKLSGIKFQL